MTEVSKFANIGMMNYTIEYFHARVKAEIQTWPDGILADYARLVELLMEFGPNLRMPHSRAMGSGVFSGTGIAHCPEKDEGGAKWLM